MVQPLFQVLAPNATFFLYHRAQWSDVLLVVLALCAPAFGVFWCVEWAAARVGARFALACRVALLVGMAGLLFVQPLKRVEHLDPRWLLPLTLLLGLASATAYLRFDPVRRWLTLLSATLPVFVALFLLAPDVRTLAALGRVEPSSQVEIDPHGPNVVLLILDALPLATLFDEDFGIDRDLYPNFARLADTSHWFRNASTVSSMTRLALPAILTGNAPSGPGAATLIKYPNNLFTLLDAAYESEIYEPVSKLAPRSAASDEEGPAVVGPILADLWILYRHLVSLDPQAANLPTVGENWGGFAQLGLRPRRVMTPSEEVPDDPRGRQFEAFIDSLERRNRGQLYFHHTLLSHKPSRYLPSGRLYRVLVPTEDRQGIWWVDPTSVGPRNYLRHVLQMQYTDRLLGRMLDRLEAQDMLQSSILVVCADHGQTFWPSGGSRVDLRSVAHPDDILRVPLFIKAPGQTAGTVDDRNVDLRDITPAIADLLGIELPWETAGHSPFKADFPERPQKRLADEQGTELVFPGAFAPDLATRELHATYAPARYSQRRLYRSGPLPELIGEPVESFETIAADFSFTLDEAPELAALDPASVVWPVRLSGTLEDPAASAGSILVLAINGLVEATQQLKFRQGRSIFSVFVAEEAFRGGRNLVEVLVVDGASGAVRRSTGRAR